MPETITLADGTEREVPTAEEVAALQTKAQSAESIQAELAKKEEELKVLSEGVSPNWREIRQKLDDAEKLKKTLQDSGKALNPDGQIVDQPKSVTTDDIAAIASRVTQKTLVQEHVNSKLKNLDQSTRAQVESFYNALTNGKELTSETANNFLEASLRAAGVEQPKAPSSFSNNSLNGGEPARPTEARQSKQAAIDMLKEANYKFNSKDPSKLIT